MTKKYKIEIKWGIIFTAVLLVWMVFEKMMGWHSSSIEDHAVYTNFFALPAIVMYVAALLDKRKTDYSGKMTWKQGFFAGLIVTLVVVILSPLAQWVIHTLISPEYFPNIIDYSVSSGAMQRNEAESYFSLTSYMIQGVIGAFAMGIITSAVVAVFTRK